MGTPQDKPIASTRDHAPVYDPGVWVNLEGGEVDTTIRPSEVLRQARAHQQAESTAGSNGQPASSERASGPDLEDWLNRTFD